MKEDTARDTKSSKVATHFSLSQNNKMPPLQESVVWAVHRSLCRNFHSCIFDFATVTHCFMSRSFSRPPKGTKNSG